ncbi:unnamed protein product [Cochlearia groenlandica]
MQLMAERTAASRSASSSASASGTATTSQPTLTSATLPIHADASPLVQTGAPPLVQTGAPPPVQTEAPPPPPPPHDQPDGAVPGPVYPEVDVPGHIPYPTLRVEDILAQPGHDNLRRLDPHKTANTYCTVSDWKDKWRDLRDAAKPIFISTAVWDGLKAYWKDGQNANVATKCSTFRITKLPDGTTKLMTHTSGKIPFVGCSKEEKADYRVGIHPGRPVGLPIIPISGSNVGRDAGTSRESCAVSEDFRVLSVLAASNPDLQRMMQTDPNHPT